MSQWLYPPTALPYTEEDVTAAMVAFSWPRNKVERALRFRTPESVKQAYEAEAAAKLGEPPTNGEFEKALAEHRAKKSGQ